MTFGEVITGWRYSAPFRTFFLAELVRARHPAIYWEMPPIESGGLARDYECVVLEGAALERVRADPGAFLGKLEEARTQVAAFDNLGGDAVLVVPRPVAEVPGGYGHLGAFLRAAPEGQRHDLLITLGTAIEDRLRDDARPLWVSTAGLGVPWLHIRLDTRPKYYKHTAYRAV
jgi:hypothetical protein